METFNSPFTNPKLVGNEKISGIPVAIQEGYVTMGYIADKMIPFGAVCKEVAKTNKCTLGTSSVISEIAGVAIYDASIMERRPACSDSYLPSMQCSILIKGLVWYHVDDTTDLSKGVKVFASKNNGDVQFSGTAPTSDYIECAFMHVVRIDRLANAVLVYVDILACEQADVGTLKEKVERLITNYTALEQRVTALETPKA